VKQPGKRLPERSLRVVTVFALLLVVVLFFVACFHGFQLERLVVTTSKSVPHSGHEITSPSSTFPRRRPDWFRIRTKNHKASLAIKAS